MATRSSINDFPAETIKELTAQVDPADLPSFRAVCRDWHTAADDIFLKTFFVKRTHLFWEQSLDELIQISQERRIAERVREITIVTQCSLLLCKNVECYDESKELGAVNEFVVVKGSDEAEGLDEAEGCDERLPDHENDSSEHGHRSNYAELSKMFLEVLSNLANHSPKISLAVSSRASESAYMRSEFLSLRMSEKGDNFKRDDFSCGKYSRCDHEVAELILATVAKSPILIDNLNISYNDLSFGLWPLDTSKESMAMSLRSSLRTVLLKLTVLKLGINANRGSASSMNEVLHNAVNLQDLYLAIFPHPVARSRPVTRPYGCPLILEQFNRRYTSAPFPLPKLKKLELQWIMAGHTRFRRDIFGFIGLFSASLIHLRLARMFFGRRRRLIDAIEDLVHLPRLQQPDIHGLDTTASLAAAVVEDITITDEGSDELDGERGIATALKKFANHLRQLDFEEASEGNDS